MDRRDILSNVWRDGIFKDRVVFCTGGNGSICSTQIRALVYLGADACIVGRNPKKSEEAAKSIQSVRRGSRVIGIGEIDVRNIQSLQSAVDECVKQLGAIDYAIAGAAGNFLSPISGLSANAFKSVVDIDLIGSFNTAKVVLPHLVQSARKHAGITGRMIFISATFHYVGFPTQAHVAAAKAGVDALSASIAIEYGPLGVQSNVISPGPIKGTEGMSRLANPVESKEAVEGAWVPVGRYGTVKEIADATVFLFSDAGNYVNGTVLVVDGGAWRTMGTGSNAAMRYPEAIVEAYERASRSSKL